MKLIEKIFSFEGDAFKDHGGKTSMGRGAIALLVVATIALVFLATALAAFLDPKQSKAILPFYQPGLTGFAGLATLIAGFVYGGKAAAQTADAKAKAATAPPTTPPEPAKPSAPTPPTTPATGGAS